MHHEMSVLIITSITIACLHTCTGPDHYIPFIALSRSRGWSLYRTIFWTLICGCGHVWSSVLLGLCGAALGWSISKIKVFENIRGGIAGWALLVFGLVYGIWGIILSSKNKKHKHFDIEGDQIYVFEHRHGASVMPQDRHVVTPWVMFLIFILGPCEPMIPLLYFPAAKSSWFGMALLICVYTFFTLLSMVVMVLLGYYGIAFLKTDKLEKHIHILGGLTIFVCGAGIIFLNW